MRVVVSLPVFQKLRMMLAGLAPLCSSFVSIEIPHISAPRRFPDAFLRNNVGHLCNILDDLQHGNGDTWHPELILRESLLFLTLRDRESAPLRRWRSCVLRPLAVRTKTPWSPARVAVAARRRWEEVQRYVCLLHFRSNRGSTCSLCRCGENGHGGGGGGVGL